MQRGKHLNPAKAREERKGGKGVGMACQRGNHAHCFLFEMPVPLP
jgi:hypothetical protein